MSIKCECKFCGNTDLKIDLERKAIWCDVCGNIEQISFAEYDYEEVD
jgi:hypothetical protein